MKKIAIVAALAALSASAFAQSSVTLWGRLNTSVESIKEGTNSRVVKMVNNNSRLGFKGTEDLGGGLKASFALEHGLNSDDGKATNAAFWNREASVQLAGSFGAVRLGKWTPGSYFATADYVSMHNHDTGNSEDKLYSGAGFTTTNKIGYFTPNIDGFSGEVAVHLGEGAAGEKRSTDLAGNYDQGPLHLGAGYSEQGDAKQWGARALYELGEITIGGYYQRADEGAAGTKAYNIYRLAAMYTMGASEFHVNFGSAANNSTVAGVDTSGKQFTLAYNYNLSKRTKVYGFYTNLDKKINSGDLSSLAVGIRHNF
ncbi:porin [Roseateles aquae]